MAVITTHTSTRNDARPGQAAPSRLRRIPIAGTRPRPSAPAVAVVKAYLKTQLATLGELEPKVRADEFDSVHQMRVTTRRLRATLRSFGTVIPRSATSELAAELKWLGGLLGEARDGEVLPGHLLASLEQVPAELLIGPVQARVHLRPALRARAAPRRTPPGPHPHGLEARLPPPLPQVDELRFRLSWPRAARSR
jgi:CHAD domain